MSGTDYVAYLIIGWMDSESVMEKNKTLCSSVQIMRCMYHPFDAVAFLPPDVGISKAERRLIDSYAGRKLLLIVCGSPDKAASVADYLGSSPSSSVTVICPDTDSSPALRDFVLGSMAPRTVIDITYASPYYASSMTSLAAAPGVSVVFTGDDAVETIVSGCGNYADLDDDDTAIVMSLMSGPKKPADVVSVTGINAKTAYRRLSALEARGLVSRTGGRPITYLLDGNQRFRFGISGKAGRPERVPADPSWVVLD